MLPVPSRVIPDTNTPCHINPRLFGEVQSKYSCHCKDSIFLCYQQFSLEILHVNLVVGICYLLNSKTCYENNSLFMIKASKCKTVRKSPERRTLFSIFYDTLTSSSTSPYEVTVMILQSCCKTGWIFPWLMMLLWKSFEL